MMRASRRSSGVVSWELRVVSHRPVRREMLYADVDETVFEGGSE